MSFLSALANLGRDIEHVVVPGQQAPQALPQAPIAQAGYSPDITYNPSPNTNIPYSSHNLQQVQNSHGVFQPQQFRQILPDYAPVQQYSGNSQGIGIQGVQNPGYIAAQSGQFSRYMPIQNGYDQNIQF